MAFKFTKYRIVQDNYAGYEAQVKKFYEFTWREITMYNSLGEKLTEYCNTNETIDAAKIVIENYKNRKANKRRYEKELKKSSAPRVVWQEK